MLINRITASAIIAISTILAGCAGGSDPVGPSAPPPVSCVPNSTATRHLQPAVAGASILLSDVSDCKDSASVNRYLWTLVTRPVKSQGYLHDPTSTTPTFFADLPGLYTFRRVDTTGATQEKTLFLVAQPSGTSPDLAAHSLLNPASAPTLEFNVNQAMNNQGLAAWNGYYYVGYDIGSGRGNVERYDARGVLDRTYGGVGIPTRHTAELAYRSADGRIYAASGGGAEPTYVYRLSADGKAVETTLDFTSFGNSALLAIDNANDLLLLSSTATGGDFGNPTFRLIDWNDNNRIVSEFTLPYLGVPQGLEIHEGLIYYYTNNKITLIDLLGNILASRDVPLAGESEGITLVIDGTKKYLAVGYNQPRRIYTIR